MLRRIHTALFILLFGLGTLAYRQNAQIQGRISDTTGAIISKAVVRVVDQQTNTARTVSTNSAGLYVVSGLTPGQYKLFASAAGFGAAVSNEITLNVAQTEVLDFTLTIGSTSEQVEVTGNNTGINTTDASVSTVIDRNFVQDIPLNGRSFQTLIMLSPGVVTSSPQGGR